MEQKTVSGKIPAELHARFRSEMEARGWTMSFALEQVINEHFENEKGRNNTMENTRTLAFAVSEEFFQLVKEYLVVHYKRACGTWSHPLRRGDHPIREQLSEKYEAVSADDDQAQ